MAWFALVALLLSLPADGLAQSDEDTTAVPRTPWSHPDLQGIWDFRTLTPLERPRELGGRAFFTDEEATEFAARLLQRWRQGPYREISPLAAAGGGGDFGTAVTSDKRSSLIVDRPDGRIPPLDPGGGGDHRKTETTPDHRARRGGGSWRRAGGPRLVRALYLGDQLWTADVS